MRNLLLIMMLMVCLSGCSLNTGGFSPSVLNQKTLKYYCPESQNHSSYTINELYVPSDNCESQKNFFWKIINSEGYEKCLIKNEKLKVRYDAGECEKVILHKHVVRGGKCSIEVTEKTNKIISTACAGINPDRAMRQVKDLYR
ncbi:hypothetical protein IKP85_05660 [bacterium]|nr:hypothetical protein [bacterium]